ncbi:MAG: YkgJ family cysteine cluster protein [Hyphomicrobiaceae bacterium]
MSLADEGESDVRDGVLCTLCGACCAYAEDWPRFTGEEASELARLPGHLLNDDRSGMRWVHDRCAALQGEVGRETRCLVYEDRPDVCRACLPGDEACEMARGFHGLAAIRHLP